MPQGLAVYHAVKPTRDNETYYAHGHLLDFPRGSDLVLPSGRFSLAHPGCKCGCPNIVVHCRLAMRVIHNQGLPCLGEGFCCSLHFPHGDATVPNALGLIWKPSDDDMAIFGSTNPDDWPNEWAWRSDCADDHGSSSCPTDSNGNSVTMPVLGNDAGLGGAANAESFENLEELVSALDAMSPEDSAGARLWEEATIVIAGASQHNRATFRKLFSTYFRPPRRWRGTPCKTGVAEMKRLLRQKLSTRDRKSVV